MTKSRVKLRSTCSRPSSAIHLSVTPRRYSAASGHAGGRVGAAAGSRARCRIRGFALPHATLRVDLGQDDEHGSGAGGKKGLGTRRQFRTSKSGAPSSPRPRSWATRGAMRAAARTSCQTGKRSPSTQPRAPALRRPLVSRLGHLVTCARAEPANGVAALGTDPFSWRQDLLADLFQSSC